MRHLAPWLVVSCAVCATARAQNLEAETTAPEQSLPGESPEEGPDEPLPVEHPRVPDPPVEAPVVQARDSERPPSQPVESEPPVATGLRLFVALQLNTLVGDIDVPMIDGSGAPPTRPSLAGIPDALIGVRIDRFTAGVGLSWSQVGVSTPMADPCGGMTFENFETVQTTIGVVPTARFDVAITDDGRGRLEAGVAVPILISNRSQDMSTFMCPLGRMTTDSTTGIYGVDAMFGGRFHVFEALAVGLEFGLSFLVFDAEDLESTPFEEPSATSLAAYAGLSLAIEVGI